MLFTSATFLFKLTISCCMSQTLFETTYVHINTLTLVRLQYSHLYSLPSKAFIFACPNKINNRNLVLKLLALERPQTVSALLYTLVVAHYKVLIDSINEWVCDKHACIRVTRIEIILALKHIWYYQISLIHREIVGSLQPVDSFSLLLQTPLNVKPGSVTQRRALINGRRRPLRQPITGRPETYVYTLKLGKATTAYKTCYLYKLESHCLLIFLYLDTRTLMRASLVLTKQSILKPSLLNLTLVGRPSKYLGYMYLNG